MQHAAPHPVEATPLIGDGRSDAGSSPWSIPYGCGEDDYQGSPVVAEDDQGWWEASVDRRWIGDQEASMDEDAPSMTEDNPSIKAEDDQAASMDEDDPSMAEDDAPNLMVPNQSVVLWPEFHKF